MQRWEYLRILIIPDEQTPFNLSAILVNGENILNEPMQAESQIELQCYLYQFLNKLGAQGWEMATAKDGLYHFKRPQQPT
ncbi:MAG: hypothetical protein GY803_09770 [Chloroflexi bacterium]|nr:hypothetical protein [Chloroflexota bacterium]